MTRWTRARRAEDGFTLVELVIVIVLIAMVAGGLTATFLAANNSNTVTAERARETTDAQLVGAWLTRDAQAAGATNPFTATRDAAYGVALADEPGCAQSGGTAIASLKWEDYASNGLTNPTVRVATYDYVPGSNSIVRVACTNGSVTTTQTLASYVNPSPVPAFSCTPACSSTDPSNRDVPNIVTLTFYELNSPQNAPSPYKVQLSASLRPDGQMAPSAANGAPYPLLLLASGPSCISGGGSALGVSAQGGGASTLRINGTALINGASPSCPELDFQGSIDYIASGGTTVLSPGTCNGTTCSTFTTPLTDPFASMVVPTHTCSGSNPSKLGNGHYGPGTYPQLLTISGNETFDPGTYVFCNGLTVSGTLDATSGVTLVMAGGTLNMTGTMNAAAPSSGTYSGIVYWQLASDTTTVNMCCSNNAVANFNGTMYVPGALVSLHNGTIWIKQLVALAVQWNGGGNGGTTIGATVAPLQITGPSSITSPWTRNAAYPSQQITATGGAGTYTWSASGLPAGVSIDPSTGVISGTPTASCSCNVTVTVTDAFNTQATKSYTLTVNAQLATTGPASLPSWTQNKAYSAITITTSGGTAPLGFTATGLPPGLTINAGTGVISGTPTAAGSYTANVTVTDNVGATATRAYPMTINPPIAITGPASLPNGQQGVAYPGATETSSGGTGAISWSATGLPTGLTINAGTGAISGTPTVVGSFTVNVTATDTVGATATQSYSMNVAVVPFTVTALTVSNAGTAGTVDKGDTIVITYNKPISVASMCASWSNDTQASQTLSGTVHVTVTNNGAANDTLTVTTPACTFNFGSLDTGSTNWVTSGATVDFSGSGTNASSVTYTYSATTPTLTIVIGKNNGPGTVGSVAAPGVVMPYSPSTALKDVYGNSISAGPYNFGNRRF